jgi:hypothetical protein
MNQPGPVNWTARIRAAIHSFLVVPVGRLRNVLRPIKRATVRWLYDVACKLRKWARPLRGEFLYFHLRNRSLEWTTRRHRRPSDPHSLIDAVKEKNLVFSVTAGRTGTLFAQGLLQLLPDTTSLHEPEPAFHRYLRRIQYNPDFSREFLLSYKLPAIVNYPTRSYCELSHVFCKGYFEPLLELGITPNLLVLRRRPRAIALSLLERNTVPERTYYGLQFLLSPSYPGVLPLAGWRKMTDYQLLFWYAIEIERRQEAYTSLVQQNGGIACCVTAQELNEFDCFLSIATKLQLVDPLTERAALVRSHAALANVRYHKNRFPMRYLADLDAEEEQVWQRLSIADPQLRLKVAEWKLTASVHLENQASGSLISRP